MKPFRTWPLAVSTFTLRDKLRIARHIVRSDHYTMGPHLRSTAFPFFDLLKLNCEGSEAEIMEHILEQKAARMFGRILVQFHPIFPNFEQRYAAIAEGLSATHECEARKPWVWERWVIRL